MIHLTNNSVQKHSKKGNIEDSMWEMKKLQEHLGARQWEELQRKMKNIVVSTKHLSPLQLLILL